MHPGCNSACPACNPYAARLQPYAPSLQPCAPSLQPCAPSLQPCAPSLQPCVHQVAHALDTAQSWWLVDPHSGEYDDGAWWDEHLARLCAPYQVTRGCSRVHTTGLQPHV